MSLQTEPFTVGVEEEYQIIDLRTRELCPRSHHILPIARSYANSGMVQLEFRQSQIEVATPICHSLAEVRRHLSRLRQLLSETAQVAGYCLAAAGTHPFSHWQEQPLTPNPYYQHLVHRYQGLMQELVTFGCHVHVGIRDREMAIQVMNRARHWLAPLLALSASSPFWLGTDTQYASYRTILIRRLPMTGAPQPFASYQDYQAVVQGLLTAQIIDKPTQVCWDLRPSERYPTLEFRIPDMPLTIDETIMLTGLVRGLVRTCYEKAKQNVPFSMVRSEVLAAAQWQAARWGLVSELVDSETQVAIPAPKLIHKLLDFVRPALEDWGEWEEVANIVHCTLEQGTGAARQRHVFAQQESLTAVVDYLVQEMCRGCDSVPFMANLAT